MHLSDEAATKQLASQFARCLSAPLVITLSGEIGAGKTTFVRALLRALHVKEPVKSPTFSLVETYVLPDMGNHIFHHFDLYRIDTVDELEYIGFRDYFSKNSICCIEWPERAPSCLGPVDVHLLFELYGSGRQATFKAQSETGRLLLGQCDDA